MANEQPGAQAIAIGAGASQKTIRAACEKSRKSKRSAMSQFAKTAHKQVARAVGYCLTLGTQHRENWDGLSVVLAARLTPEERAALALAALQSLDDRTAYRTASVALFGTLDGEVVA